MKEESQALNLPSLLKIEDFFWWEKECLCINWVDSCMFFWWRWNNSYTPQMLLSGQANIRVNHIHKWMYYIQDSFAHIPLVQEWLTALFSKLTCFTHIAILSSPLNFVSMLMKSTLIILFLKDLPMLSSKLIIPKLFFYTTNLPLSLGHSMKHPIDELDLHDLFYDFVYGCNSFTLSPLWPSYNGPHLIKISKEALPPYLHNFDIPKHWHQLGLFITPITMSYTTV